MLKLDFDLRSICLLDGTWVQVTSFQWLSTEGEVLNWPLESHLISLLSHFVLPQPLLSARKPTGLSLPPPAIGLLPSAGVAHTSFLPGLPLASLKS